MKTGSRNHEFAILGVEIKLHALMKPCLYSHLTFVLITSVSVNDNLRTRHHFFGTDEIITSNQLQLHYTTNFLTPSGGHL